MEVRKGTALSSSKGYKQTEVGVIPEDWDVKKIMHICSMKSGKTITSESISELENYPCYGGNGLRGYTKSHTHSGAYTLIGRQGALCGNITFVDCDFFASEHAIVTSPNSQTDIKWLSYVLYRMNLNQYTESSAQPGLSVQKILELPIPIPPTKSEQTAIATALSDADALITFLEKLIEKKRAIKQGAMQELLKPKEGWEVKKLGDYSKITSGESPSKFNFKSTGIPYFKVEQLNNCEKYQIETPYYIETGNVIPKGSIIFPKRGASILLNKVRILKEDSYMDTNLMTLTLAEELSSEFVYYVLIHIELWRIADTTSIPQINNKHINPIEIPFPPLEEQTRIATILSDMDAEITALEQKLAKYKQIKQGMMQELLTGRIRLV